ncbi:hypothetical protein I6U48_04225 [Clostridium sp. PL3]|uniref:Uncharacterized protein n=1 Tax=Clostridium thailandense TaxID=2794346 RepID=A0A949TG14_9CLOT|nr:hypothetical protein [Clostridium thailandense]MBV7272124.1 hypothetical protein [Clostridium thailandense]
MNSIIDNIGKLITSFQDKITEIQVLVSRSLKIVTGIIVAFLIIYVIRECLSWRMQIKLQKQNEELLKRMNRIIDLLERNLKIK